MELTDVALRESAARLRKDAENILNSKGIFTEDEWPKARALAAGYRRTAAFLLEVADQYVEELVKKGAAK